MLVQGEVGDRNIHSASISTFFWGSPYPYWYTFSCILPYLLPDSILDRVTTNAVYEKVGFVFQGHLNPKWKFVIKNYKQ